MGIIAPTNMQIVKCATKYHACDYQKYLQSYDARYLDYWPKISCNFDGIAFGVCTGKEVSALATFAHQKWDTQCFDFEVAKISALMGDDVTTKNLVLQKTIDHARSKGIRLLTCRTAADDFSSIHALEKSGFKLADAMNIFLWDSKKNTPEIADRNFVIKPFDHTDRKTRQTISTIASNAFHHSRIYNDPNFTKDQKENFHKQLIEGFLDNRQALNLVAWMDGRPAGFVIGAVDDTLSASLQEPLGYLWLIAVDKTYTGRGLGRMLLNHFLATFSHQVRYIEVGTQIHNYAALNLYAQNGLKLVASLTTLHLWL